MEGYATPEEAALADWAGIQSAHARVIGVEPAGEDEAVVRVLLDGTTGFHDVDVILCRRTPEGFWSTAGSSGGNSR